MNNKPLSYSILELANVAAGGTIQQTLNDSAAVAQLAEQLGYQRFWLAEHHNAEFIGSSATSVLIGYIAEKTSTIRVGSGGIMLPNHSPLIVAEQFGTLAHLYPNRIDLGLGRAPGTDQATARAIRSDFMEAAQHFPADIAAIQQYFSTDNKSAKVRATVAEGRDVPIYILGSSTAGASVAANLGLPYAFASHFASTYLHAALSIYRNEFQASAQLQQPYTMAGINVYLANTPEEAERLYTAHIRMFLGVLTGKHEGVHPATDMTPDLRELMKHPALQQMIRYSFVGTKTSVKPQLEAFVKETGVDELIAVSIMHSVEDRLKSVTLFAEVMNEINT
jgi:luciferase family oxidoreductase group 1